LFLVLLVAVIGAISYLILVAKARRIEEKYTLLH